jgi:predicted TIM-barrel fold metal-dependent hydrolase
MIDVHVHLHPRRLFAAIRRWFAERSPWELTHATEPESVARTLADAGVERFVFCSYAHKPGIARELNGWLAATSRALDGRGLPLATVHLDDADPAGDVRAALDDGCIGLKVHEDVQRLAVDDPRFAPVFARVAERDGFVLAHVGPIPWSSDTRDGPARVERVLERHPGLRLVVAHLGAPDSRRYFALMRSRPTLYLDTTMAFAGSFAPEITAGEIEAVAGRVVYGTDYPNIPYEYERERAKLETLGLSAGTLRAILGENARRLSSALA